MKKFTGLLLAVFIHALIFQTALAQDGKTALVPLPSVDDFTRGNDGWAFGLGLSVEYESAYEGSDEYDFEVDPAGAVQWRSGDDIFYWAGEALGWRGLRSDIWLLDAALAFDEGREEDDSDDGLGLLAVGRRFGDQNDGTGHEIAVAVVFHDSDYANKDFGIDAEQSASSGLEETDLSGGFRSVGLNYNYRHYIDENWQIFGEAVYERYSSDIEDSPIARNNYEAEVGVGFIYVF
jgi:outer membrane scaffolding protein for murein synthesis (MipA/OmpV family)